MTGFSTRIALISGLLVFLLSVSPRAEVVRTVSVSTVFDTNAMGDSSAQADYLTQVSGSLSWWHEGKHSQTQVYYASDGYVFAQVGARTFAVNQLGATYVRQLGRGNNYVYVGTSLAARLGRLDYGVYNHVGWHAYATLKWYVQPSVMVRMGYTMRHRNYWNLTPSSYVDHHLFAQANKFFPTRTTLRGDASYGLKRHGASEGQVTLGLQVAQALTANTGASLRYERRLNTQDGALGLESLFQDADILNDRYDYSGHEWLVRLTQQLPYRMRLIVEGGYEVRHYKAQTTGTLIDLLFGVPAAPRTDKNPHVSATLELPIGDRVHMRFTGEMEKNRSTNTYYDYSGRRVLSMDLGFEF